MKKLLLALGMSCVSGITYGMQADNPYGLSDDELLRDAVSLGVGPVKSCAASIATGNYDPKKEALKKLYAERIQARYERNMSQGGQAVQ